MMWLKLLWGIMAKKTTVAAAALVSTKAKIGGSLAGICAAGTLMFSYVDNRIADVKDAMTSKELTMVRYVDSKHGEVKEDLAEIKDGIIKLDKRFYEFLKSQTNKQPNGG